MCICCCQTNFRFHTTKHRQVLALLETRDFLLLIVFRFVEGHLQGLVSCKAIKMLNIQQQRCVQLALEGHNFLITGQVGSESL